MYVHENIQTHTLYMKCITIIVPIIIVVAAVGVLDKTFVSIEWKTFWNKNVTHNGRESILLWGYIYTYVHISWSIVNIVYIILYMYIPTITSLVLIFTVYRLFLLYFVSIFLAQLHNACTSYQRFGNYANNRHYIPITGC